MAGALGGACCDLVSLSTPGARPTWSSCRGLLQGTQYSICTTWRVCFTDVAPTTEGRRADATAHRVFQGVRRTWSAPAAALFSGARPLAGRCRTGPRDRARATVRGIPSDCPQCRGRRPATRVHRLLPATWSTIPTVRRALLPAGNLAAAATAGRSRRLAAGIPLPALTGGGDSPNPKCWPIPGRGCFEVVLIARRGIRLLQEAVRAGKILEAWAAGVRSPHIACARAAAGDGERPHQTARNFSPCGRWPLACTELTKIGDAVLLEEKEFDMMETAGESCTMRSAAPRRRHNRVVRPEGDRQRGTCCFMSTRLPGSGMTSTVMSRCSEPSAEPPFAAPPHMTSYHCHGCRRAPPRCPSYILVPGVATNPFVRRAFDLATKARQTCRIRCTRHGATAGFPGGQDS